MPRPQAKGSSGSAPARASCAARPTLLSTAEDTTQGRPQDSATRSARRTPPSGVALMIATSAAPATAMRSGSSAWRMLSSAAIRTSTRPRTAASSSIVGHGCSAYSRPPAALSSSRIRAIAVSASQAALASTRIAPFGPSASRTAATRSTSSPGDWPGSATLIFAVPHPDAATIAAALSAGTAGTVQLTGMLSRIGSGQSSVHASSAARSHGTDWLSS